jgi:HlyD family secretion protein
MRHRKILVLVLLLVGGIGLLTWLPKAIGWKGKVAVIKMEVPVRMDIINKRVISGVLVPYKEVALKAEIAGVIDKLYVSVGDRVSKGQAIARIKVLPKSSEIESAKKGVHISQFAQEVAEAKYQRSKQLFENKMLSPEAYEQDVKAWKIACEESAYAQKELNYVLKGHITGAQGASNTIKSTIAGIVSELPCKEGSVIMERRSYEGGTTVATISDMSTILFQGKVGEMDVAHLYTGMQFEVSLIAIKGKKFLTTLTKLAPKAIEAKQGQSSRGDESVKFAIEGRVQISEDDRAVIRSGYTAMADIVLEKAIDVLAIKEKSVHTEEDISTQKPTTPEAAQGGSKPFVWIYENKKKVKKYIELGVSDGIYVEVKQSLTANDQVIMEDDSH